MVSYIEWRKLRPLVSYIALGRCKSVVNYMEKKPLASFIEETENIGQLH